MQGASISLRDVARRFPSPGGDIWAINGVSLEVGPGESLTLVGRSGSGKTTLLNIIGGLDHPTGGQVLLDGQRIDRLSDEELTRLRRRQISFIFQSFGLLPLLSAEENVEIALRIAGLDHSERVRRSRDALAWVGLEGRAHHRPYELSGGEQQRVAIARALATEPRLLLADEPTGELDSVTARAIFLLLRDLAQQRGTTVVTCTHDRLVMELSDRVEELADGRIVTGDERRVYLAATAEPASPFGDPLAGGLSSLVGADRSRFARPANSTSVSGEPEP